MNLNQHEAVWLQATADFSSRLSSSCSDQMWALSARRHQ